jgi:hypothetical protein
LFIGYDFQIIAQLLNTQDTQGGGLSRLFQVVAGHPSREDGDPAAGGNLDGAQRHVTRRSQGALDPFGHTEIF